LTMCSARMSWPVFLLMRLHPTGSMLRLSSQPKSTPLVVEAEYSATGTCTKPKLMAPSQMVRLEVGLTVSHRKLSWSVCG
jgi:hypothetical protein